MKEILNSSLNRYMTRITLLLVLFFSATALKSQTIKTGVMVVGNTSSAIAAAIQSARSGAKTYYIIPESSLNAQFRAKDIPNIIQIKNYYLLKDKRNKAKIDTQLTAGGSQAALNALIKGILDTTRNLTMLSNASISKVEKDGKGWELRLKTGQKVKGDVLVDATEKLQLSSMVKTDPARTVVTPTGALFESKHYRTALAYGTFVKGNIAAPTVLPAGALLPAGAENFLVIPKNTTAIKFDPMSAGQAAGIMAAYCAFFNTTTKSINIRIAQGELLAFNSTLIPLSDISSENPNKTSLQRVILSGLLKPKRLAGDDEKLVFDTAGTVSTEELRVPTRELFSRSQLWFADHKKDIMTVEDAISLLKFTATRGDELTREIEEGWNSSFNFQGKFDLQRPVTRLEFAVLADRYLQPFNVRTDFQGNLLS